MFEFSAQVTHHASRDELRPPRGERRRAGAPAQAAGTPPLADVEKEKDWQVFNWNNFISLRLADSSKGLKTLSRKYKKLSQKDTISE